MIVLMQAAPNKLTDDARYRAILEELIADWDRRQWDGRRVELDNMEQFLLVTGFAAHGYEQARAFSAALDNVPEIVLMPLVRAVYEGGITAQWLALVPDGWKAIAKEHARQRNLLGNEYVAMRTPAHEAVANRLTKSVQHDPARLASPHETQGRSFKKRCADLLPRDLYLHFRHYSSTAHPTVAVPEYWIHSPSTPGGPIQIEKPEFGRDDDVLHTMVVCLLWFAGAQTVLAGDSEWNDYLQGVARQICLPLNLELSPAYHDRMKGT